MIERNRPQQEHPTGPGQGPGFFNQTPEGLQSVRVSCGQHNNQLPVANMTVGEIRRRFHDRFQIAPNSQAILDGHAVQDDVVVRAGQSLAFTRAGGEKGRTP